MSDLNVKKRDGTMEPFSYDKLVTSISKAGVPIKSAEEVASEVTSYIQNQGGEKGEIMSTLIRDKIIEVLSKDFPVEADNYQSFKKS